MKKRNILIIMKDNSGVLSKVSGLFQKRGINIDTITAGRTSEENRVRMTISGSWNEHTVNQVISQARKLYDVTMVKEFTESSVERELALIKIGVDNENRSQVVELTRLYRGSIIDTSKNNVIVELTGGREKIEGYLEVAEEFGVLEVARTGVTSMHRGLGL